MTNGDLGNVLASEILRSISREYGWPDHKVVEVTVVAVDASVLKAYVGEYQLGGVVTVSVENGKLFIQPPGQQRVELLPISETEFQLRAQNVRVRFVKDAQGAVSEFTLIAPNGQQQTAKRSK